MRPRIGPLGYDAAEAGQRALSGLPQRRQPWLPARGLVVLASDLDPDAGVAAVSLIRHARSADPSYGTCLYEGDGHG